ncbi:MAG TPA: Spy/CpxP family protein refolding chaperone [Bryobacteraceae bacterium]|jgi:hypothetical protein
MITKVLLSAVAAAALALAQPGGGGVGQGGGEGIGGGMDRGGGMERGGMEGMGGMSRMRTPAKYETFFDKLKLSKDQKTEVTTLFEAAQEEAAPIRDQIQKGRQVIAQALLGKKSADEIDKYMQAYAQLNAQMTGIEAKTFSKVYAMLKPNQQKNAPQAFELLTGIFQAGNWRMVR